MLKKLLLIFLLATPGLAAKTDLAGCSLTVVPLLTQIVTTTGQNGVVGSFGDYSFTTFQWDGTEQCQLLDCGGGRAPPKTDVPGCPGYTGTDTVPALGFPTASLTLGPPVSTPTAAPGAPLATASPSAAISSPPLPTNTGITTPSGQGAAPTSSSSPTTAESDNATTAAPLNPTVTKNGAMTAAGARGVLWGVVAVVVALASA